MGATTTSLQNARQEVQDERLIDLHQSPSDFGHIIVRRCKSDGVKETIGHIYTEVEGEEIQYICTNRNGREVFPISTDFNALEIKFERYARLLAEQDKAKENDKQLQNHNYSLTKNSTTMKTTTKNPGQTRTKLNQLIFTEYEKATKDGHFITIRDSYHNAIGRIHKSFNEETRKFEYTSFDHEGNPISKSEKLWELKNEYVSNRDQLLEQAHQRRIESNEKARQTQEQNQPTAKSGAPEKESENNKKTVDDKQSRQMERDQELEDLRGEKEDDRGDMDLEV